MGESSKPVSNASPATYAVMYARLVSVAKRHGYALAIHGTMTRDCDLIAVPWTAEAVEALVLIRAFKEDLAAVTHHSGLDHHFPDCNPKVKPHGRLAYSLHLTDEGCYGPYLDVSVMPRVEVAP